MGTLIRRYFVSNRSLNQSDCFLWTSGLCFKNVQVKSLVSSKSQPNKEEDDGTSTKRKTAEKVKFKLGKKTYSLIEPLNPSSCSKKPPSKCDSPQKQQSSPVQGKEKKVPEDTAPTSVHSDRQPLNNSNLSIQSEKSVAFRPEATSNCYVTHHSNISVTVAKQSLSNQVESVKDSSHESMDFDLQLSGAQETNYKKSVTIKQSYPEENITTNVFNVDSSKVQKTSKIFRISQSDNFEDYILKATFLGKKPTWPHGPSENIMRIGSSQNDFSVPSVSHILNSTMSPVSASNLARWQELMISKLGKDGFRLYKNSLLQRGRDFHSVVEKSLLNDSIDVDIKMDSQVEACYKSVKKILQYIKNPHAVESHVVHPHLHYRGIVDCIAEYKGQPAVIEWKHSEKKKAKLLHTYDNPIQLMAYFGALNYDNNYPYQVDVCVLVIAYTDGSSADVYRLSRDDKVKFWNEWLQRLKLFWTQQRQLAGIDEAEKLHFHIDREQNLYQQENQQMEFPSKPPAAQLKPSSEVSSNRKPEASSHELSEKQFQHKAKQNGDLKDAPLHPSNFSAQPDGKEQSPLVSKSSSFKFDLNKIQESNENKNQEDKGLLNKLWKIWKS